jgi:hypothetical protein
MAAPKLGLGAAASSLEDVLGGRGAAAQERSLAHPTSGLSLGGLGRSFATHLVICGSVN